MLKIQNILIVVDVFESKVRHRPIIDARISTPNQYPCP